MEEYMAKISFFAFTWTPRNYKPCQGALLSITGNSALYSLLGTNFGGSSTSFGLPDLRGRVMVGQGISPYYGEFLFAQTGGRTTTTLTTTNMPSHTHTPTLTLEDATTTVKVSSVLGVSNVPGGRQGYTTLAALDPSSSSLYNKEIPDTELNIDGNTVSGSVTIGSTGSGQSFTNMQPYLSLNPCMVTVGLYPSRN